MLVVGTTNSGKTTLAKAWVRELQRLYPNVPLHVLDSKGQQDFAGWPGIVAQQAPPRPLTYGTAHAVQVWRPDFDSLLDYDAWFDTLFYTPGPSITLVDELSSLTRRDGTAPDSFQKLMKQGRGKGKHVINLTQELVKIPRQVVTQTTHVFRFRLVGEYDPRIGNRLVRRESGAVEPTHKHGFFYARTDGHDAPVYYRDLSEFF